MAPYREVAAEEHDGCASSRHGPAGRASRWKRRQGPVLRATRPELVVEVAYDYMEGSRFRHTAQSRWLSAPRPRTCTFVQWKRTLTYAVGMSWRRHVGPGQSAGRTTRWALRSITFAGRQPLDPLTDHPGQEHRRRRRRPVEEVVVSRRDDHRRSAPDRRTPERLREGCGPLRTSLRRTHNAQRRANDGMAAKLVGELSGRPAGAVASWLHQTSPSTATWCRAKTGACGRRDRHPSEKD